MLFTHFGVSGPMILSASASIKQSLIKQPLDMYIDLKTGSHTGGLGQEDSQGV